MKIGINSLTFNNDFSVLQKIKPFIDTLEPTKRFYLENPQLIKENIPMETMGSLIVGDYDLTNINDRKSFINELKETCTMCEDLGISKMMFGMSRFRKSPNLKFFEELYYICKDKNKILMYEAISKDPFISSHKELIEFSKRLGIDGIHVDFGTILQNNEDFKEIEKSYNILNIHFPFGMQPNINHNISLENYSGTKLSQKEIENWLKNLKQ